MAEENKNAATDTQESATRIYEIGYHVMPTVEEADVEKVVGDIRSQIEAAGGAFIAEGAPSLTRLSYPIEAREGDKYVDHDRGYFGWLKFEAPTAAAATLDESLKGNGKVLRYIIFKTVREETRARLKTPTLREVKREGTIKTTARRPEEESVPVSEADLDKAIQDLTTE